jgi:hypothetical protein
MATYRVTVAVNGTCDYDISLADGVDPVKAIDDLIHQFGSLDRVASRINDFLSEDVVQIYEVEK